MIRLSICCLCLLGQAMVSAAQVRSYTSIMTGDTSQAKTVDLYPAWLARQDKHALNFASVFVPAVGVGYGIIALHKSGPQKLNLSTKNEIEEDHQHFHTSLDNYLQLAPSAAVIGLNIAGVHGEHHFIDELCIYGVSTFIMFGTVRSLKYFTHEQRPDGSFYNAFPSGHTATAFAAAEWLRSEYWNCSPWIGIAGYAAASTTGVLRLYNNRHWVSDVVAGAAIGFLSTRIAYSVNPWIEKHILHRSNKKGTQVSYTFLECHYVRPPVYSDTLLAAHSFK